MKRFLALAAFTSALVLSGCATKKQPTDYSAFRESKPRSILVLPPKNQTPEVNASHGFVSEVTLPLSESGYYVFPVALVEETFRQNGLTTPEDISAVPVKKLHEIFGADAVLYLTVTDYGTSYQVVNSETRVGATARLVDLRTGKELWKRSAMASSDENQGYNNNGILAVLLLAAINQISDTVSDKSRDIAAIASVRLLSAGTTDGALLYGPRSPSYGKTVSQ